MSIKRDKIFFTLSCFQLSFTQIRVCWQICVAVALRACAHAHVCMCLSVRWNVRMHALFAPCFSLFSPPPSVVFRRFPSLLSLPKFSQKTRRNIQTRSCVLGQNLAGTCIHSHIHAHIHTFACKQVHSTVDCAHSDVDWTFLCTISDVYCVQGLK